MLRSSGKVAIVPLWNSQLQRDLAYATSPELLLHWSKTRRTWAQTRDWRLIKRLTREFTSDVERTWSLRAAAAASTWMAEYLSPWDWAELRPTSEARCSWSVAARFEPIYLGF